MRYWIMCMSMGMGLLFVSLSSIAFEQEITQEDRDIITEEGSIAYGIYPKDLHEILESYGFIITKKHFDKDSAQYYIQATFSQKELLWLEFKDCEIEHTPTYCTGAEIHLFANGNMDKEQQKNLLVNFWRYHLFNFSGQTILTSFLDFSDVSETYITFRIEELIRLMEELNTE